VGDLDPDDEYLIMSIFGKLLAEIVGDSVASDPAQRLLPGQQHEFPVKVTKADRRLDVVLMRPSGADIDVEVITPSGAVLPAAAAGLSVLNGTRVSRYRTSLPVADSPSHASHEGTWLVRVSIKTYLFDELIASMNHEGIDTRGLETHGLRYALQACVKSNIRMRARLYQSGYDRGASLTIRSEITENGLPAPGRKAQVKATITPPGGTAMLVDLNQTVSGVFEAVINTKFAGVYWATIVAEGLSSAGDTYRREAFLTGAVRFGGGGGPGRPGLPSR
jgi:hypothetical protein